jgi:hypothetical protein
MRWIAAAIVAVGFLIAASIAITFRYSIAPLTPMVGVSRLDHWSGKIIHCHPSQIWGSRGNDCDDPDDWVAIPQTDKPQTDQFGGVRLNCVSKTGGCTDEEVGLGKPPFDPSRPFVVVPEPKK